jgi:hypothetical protein
MYDEVHYQDGEGPAKQLQLRHRAVPADLAVLIAAAIPDPAEQEAAGLGPPAESLAWPWTEEALRARLVEARSLLARRNWEAATTSEVESTGAGMADGS